MTTLASALRAELTPPERQSLRMRRFLLALAVNCMALLILGGAGLLGLIPPWPTLIIGGAMIVLNAALYAAFRTGANQRFADPSLTKFQVGAGITLVMASIYFLDDERGLALTLCFVIFTFGVFSLGTREFVSLTLYTLACYALTINLLMHFRPGAIRSVYTEWFSWIVLATVLAGFATIAGKISAQRDRLRAGNVELRSALNTIRQLAARDELTGLYNRAFFAESFSHALARRDRQSSGLAVLFIDVDRFKSINDTLGHGVGDRVLVELATRISAQTRNSDIVARLGGDEFVVLIEGCDISTDLAGVAGKLLAAARKPLQIDGRELPLSLSIGVAVSPADGTDAETLLRCADLAMYGAKQAGGNKVRLYSKAMMLQPV